MKRGLLVCVLNYLLISRSVLLAIGVISIEAVKPEEKSS